ncbi:MAG TPA: Wzz/FepE/Etk N-terminal domain-containing protein [Acidobacteriaceae bacterium]|nr:Wzz/FepE/Etk N-terminal domain-containing protein [Acidobacteriaceae bacterium]
MLGHRELTMEDYTGILRRRWLLILCSAVICLAIGVAASYVVPRLYESQTLILIEQQKVPEDYVKPVVDENLNARLASMKEQILSRSRLEPIITRYNLFAGDKNNMDQRIDLTRKAIKITQIHAAAASGGMPGFFVAFQASDPRTAQQVCGEITSLFVSENLSARERSAEGTTDFLKQQLGDAKQTLDEQDARLAAFQLKYIGKLPNQESSNVNALQALTTQLDAATQEVNRIQQNETFLQALIAQQAHDLQSGGPSAASVDERRKELSSLIDQKKQLESLYTADYPDVVAVTRKIAALQAEIDHSPTTAKPTTIPAVHQPDSPQLVQLRAQLRAVQLSMVSARKEQTRLEQQIRAYEARIESSPMVEEQYKQITRDHDTALKFYNSLLTKMNESSMANALEQRQQGEQFSVMDPPNLPDAPKFPNHVMFAAGGLLSGLLLGFLISALLEYRDTSLRDERDIWAFTKLPTLATISYVEGLPKSATNEDRGHGGFFSRMRKPAERAEC